MWRRGRVCSTSFFPSLVPPHRGGRVWSTSFFSASTPRGRRWKPTQSLKNALRDLWRATTRGQGAEHSRDSHNGSWRDHLLKTVRELACRSSNTSVCVWRGDREWCVCVCLCGVCVCVEGGVACRSKFQPIW